MGNAQGSSDSQTTGQTGYVVPFQDLATLPLDSLLALVDEFTSKDYPFGVDASTVATLLACSVDQAAQIVERLRRKDKPDEGPLTTISALVLLYALIMCNQQASIEDKSSLIFGLLDLDHSGTLNLDALTILAISVFRAADSLAPEADPKQGSWRDVARRSPSDLAEENPFERVAMLIFDDTKLSFTENISTKAFSVWLEDTRNLASGGSGVRSKVNQGDGEYAHEKGLCIDLVAALLRLDCRI